MSNPKTPEADNSAQIITVPVETPVATASGEKTELRFRRPVSGDLRGISIGKLGQFDYDEIRKLLPRISLDGLSPDMVDKIDVADQLEIAGSISDFLVPKRRRAEFQET